MDSDDKMEKNRVEIAKKKSNKSRNIIRKYRLRPQSKNRRNSIELFIEKDGSISFISYCISTNFDKILEELGLPSEIKIFLFSQKDTIYCG